MLKIFDNYYLDACGVCYMLKKAHVKGGSKVEYDVCTYHTRLEEALAAHRLMVVWVRGHASIADNNRGDDLAVAAATRGNLPEDPR